MAPIVKELKSFKSDFITAVCVTAQHRQMLDQVLNFFEITPDYDLDIMKTGQNLFSLSANILVSMKSVLEDFKPDYVLVHGDTTTSFISSLAAFYSGARVCHVEAGLRTFNKYAPFPEEMNRSMTARIADFHFAPTEEARANLLREHISDNQIIVSGNSVIDALFWALEKVQNNADIFETLSKKIPADKPIILVTGHRRENFGEGFKNICLALKSIAESNSATIVYPVHLNPNVQEPVNAILSKQPNVVLIEPLAYPAFVWLMNKAHIIITDSGGIQEEAPSLGKPVLVMRETTERPEAVEAGTVKLVGTDSEVIFREAMQLIQNEAYYNEMKKSHNPYGDGKSAKRIVSFLRGAV